MEPQKIRAVALRCEHVRGKASRKKLHVSLCIRPSDGTPSVTRASTSAVRAKMGIVAWLDESLQTIVRPGETVVFKLRCYRAGLLEHTIGKAEFYVTEGMKEGVQRFQLDFYNSKGTFVATLHMVLQFEEIDRAIGETSQVEVGEEVEFEGEGDGEMDHMSDVSSLAVSDSMLADASIPSTPIASPDRSRNGEYLQRLLSAIPEDRARHQVQEDITLEDMLFIWNDVWFGIPVGWQ